MIMKLVEFMVVAIGMMRKRVDLTIVISVVVIILKIVVMMVVVVMRT